MTGLFSGEIFAADGIFAFPSRARYRGTYAGNDALEALYYKSLTQSAWPDSDQLTCAFKNVAAKAVRDSAFTGNVNYESPSNDTFVKQTVAGHTIAIHWRWLLLPVAVWILGTLSLPPAFAVLGVHIASIYSTDLDE